MSTNQIAIYQATRQGRARMDCAAETLTAVAEQQPGVYTVARSYSGNRVLCFERHLARLEESAQLSGIPLALDRAWLRGALRACLEELGYPEVRFCVSVPADAPDVYYLAFEPLHPVPERVLRAGVSVYTTDLNRHTPRAKSTGWIAARREARAALPADAYEGLLTGPDGAILEGTESNFYAVLDGALRTAGEGVLGGTARAVLLEVAPAVIPVRLQPATLADLPRLDEALLTSSSRGVVPITRINGQPVGDGRPGPITEALRQRYDAWAEAHLEPL